MSEQKPTNWDQFSSVDQAAEAALAAMEAEQRKLRDMEQKIAEETTTVRSKDRSLSMTFDGRGELTGLKFHDTAYRSMAPAQLANTIVETLNTGRAQCMEKLNGLVGGEVMPGVDFMGLASGKTSASEIFDSLMAPIWDEAVDSGGVLGRSVQDKDERGRRG
jgi:DNA-binding protein YbaB